MTRRQQRTWTTIAAIAALAVVLTAGTTPAMDIHPPEWRGEPETTLQIWEFNTPDPNPLPDLDLNLIGSAQAVVTPGPDDPDWIPALDDMVGVWALSGTIEVDVPNTPYDPGREKWIWLQLTWQPEPNAVVDFPIVEVIDVQQPIAPSYQLPVPGFENETILPDPPIGDWLHTTFEIYLPENPELETILIAGDIYVDELVIDTWCVPEPSGVLLAALGLTTLIGMIGRRRTR